MEKKPSAMLRLDNQHISQHGHVHMHGLSPHVHVYIPTTNKRPRIYWQATRSKIRNGNSHSCRHAGTWRNQIITTAVAILLSNFAKSEITKPQLQICLMILNQSRENWDHARWVVTFFEHMQQTEADQTNFSIDDLDFLNLPIKQTMNF